MSQVRSLNDKRDPDAPITILQAMTDIARFEELLPEMAESTVILKLLKVSFSAQCVFLLSSLKFRLAFCTKYFKQLIGPTKKELLLKKSKILPKHRKKLWNKVPNGLSLRFLILQVEGQRRAGLPEDMTLDNAEETIQKLESQGTLKKSNFDLKKVRTFIFKKLERN